MSPRSKGLFRPTSSRNSARGSVTTTSISGTAYGCSPDCSKSEYAHSHDRHSRGENPQSQEHFGRNPAAPAHGADGSVRFWKVFARLQHTLCRGAEKVCGVDVDVRAAVPRTHRS